MTGTTQALAPGVSVVRDAQVLVGSRFNHFNIVDAAGAPVADGALHRKTQLLHPSMIPEAQPAPDERLTGTWLFGGDFWQHFGHFLFESMSRLWALPLVPYPVDGILYVAPKQGDRPVCRDDSVQRELLKKVGADLPVRVVSDPVQVETLVVPRQGCGLGPLAAGTPEFREFIASRLRDGIAPGTADKVYISRQGYWLRRGGLFDEDRIANLLRREGYQIFSPHQATIEEQIATYLGARRIVSPDSTAIHLVSFVARPDQDVAVLLRRATGAKDILPNHTGFTGRRPLVVDCIKAFHRRQGGRNPSWSRFAELDLEAAGSALHKAGFIADQSRWKALNGRRRRRVLRQYMERLSCTFETEQAA